MAFKLFAKWFGNRPSQHEQRLLHKCRGDHDLAERLITAELARRPGLTRAAASERACDRWANER